MRGSFKLYTSREFVGVFRSTRRRRKSRYFVPEVSKPMRRRNSCRAVAARAEAAAANSELLFEEKNEGACAKRKQIDRKGNATS